MRLTTARFRLPIPALFVAVCLGVGVPAPAQSSGVSDRDITLAIETDLAIDDSIASHRIDVGTRNGVVTLQGRVDNILARDRALERAMATKGVRSVVNRITVETPERPAAELERDVTRALVADPATDSYEVSVSAADGVVTLDGIVDSWQEKQLSAAVAMGVRGVVAVENRIAIDYQATRSDDEIAADIEQRLGMSVWVDTRFLDVEVSGGRVTLSGTVGSEAERQRAAALAWVAGVGAVSIDGVEINWWADDRMRRRDRDPVPSDAEIARAIESALAYDPRVFAFNVEAEVERGVATLLGTVDNLPAKRAAGQNAKNTIGVWRVRNHLRVRPMAMPDGLKIASDVRKALTRDPYVERFDVEVDVVGSRVYLDGKVNTSFERRHAGDVASRVNGVVAVVNNLEHAHQWTRLPDREIRDDVETQLFWSPFVDSREITVTVENGVVTLTGTVGDWTGWRDAEANAFEGNAKDVLNELEIAAGG